MKQQGLSAEMFKEHVLSLLLDTSGDQFNSLDPKVKSLFTRSYTQLCPSSLKRVKQQKQIGSDKLLEYKEGFDPTYMDDCEAESEESEVDENDGIEVVGKSKEAKKAPVPKVQRKTKDSA